MKMINQRNHSQCSIKNKKAGRGLKQTIAFSMSFMLTQFTEPPKWMIFLAWGLSATQNFYKNGETHFLSDTNTKMKYAACLIHKYETAKYILPKLPPVHYTVKLHKIKTLENFNFFFTWVDCTNGNQSAILELFVLFASSEM